MYSCSSVLAPTPSVSAAPILPAVITPSLSLPQSSLSFASHCLLLPTSPYCLLLPVLILVTSHIVLNLVIDVVYATKPAARFLIVVAAANPAPPPD